jgi:hypothetical protein
VENGSLPERRILEKEPVYQESLLGNALIERYIG